MNKSITNNHNISFDLNILCEKYKDNTYVLNRLQTYLNNLPNWLESEDKRYQERITRINELTTEQHNFYSIFLSQHPYFYMPYNNIYYEYDGKTYTVINEDDIYHKLLTTITEEGKLMSWKHKTKQNIIRQIKERSLLKAVPETDTIQNVINYLLTIFETKIEVKYFLTLIGDCILKKNTENGLMYFINPNIKKFVSIIDSIAYVTTGNSIMSNFIMKYHDSHDLTKYRILKTINNNISYDITKEILNKIGINLLCVACHYSDRYGISDTYLMSKSNESINSHVYFFTNNTLENIVNIFIDKCLETTTTYIGTNNNNNNNISEYNITWKNIYYIWKCYLYDISIPNVVYTDKLKTILKDKLTHNITTTNSGSEIIFTNVTSKYLPSVSCFLSFWEKYIAINNNTNNTNGIDDEYEVDELLTLYKSSNVKNVSLTEESIIKMIQYYFSPQVEVIDNKYISGISCVLWDKSIDINEALEYYKSSELQKNINLDPDNNLISIDELYDKYKSFCQSKSIVNKSRLYIVSKQYFEKYLLVTLQSYIQFDKFISSSWIYS